MTVSKILLKKWDFQICTKNTHLSIICQNSESRKWAGPPIQKIILQWINHQPLVKWHTSQKHPARRNWENLFLFASWRGFLKFRTDCLIPAERFYAKNRSEFVLEHTIQFQLVYDISHKIFLLMKISVLNCQMEQKTLEHVADFQLRP